MIYLIDPITVTSVKCRPKFICSPKYVPLYGIDPTVA
jgi:hypothetical protein